MFTAKVMPRSPWDVKKNKSLVLVVGDKVIWTKNDYQLEIFNGETGIVESLDHDLVTVNFGDRTIAIPPWVEVRGCRREVERLRSSRSTWISRTPSRHHKSQGSEYHNVHITMSTSAYRLLNRANFYTAITRARKHVHSFSYQRSFQSAVVR